MRWILLLIAYLVLNFYLCHGVRRKNPRSCRAAAKLCAQRCTRYPKRFRCSCFNGFFTPKTTAKDCLDLDECATNNGGCDHTCTNIPGGFHCSCRDGYRLAADQRTCLPQDHSSDCSEINNQCEHFCNRTSTGHVCSCRQGYYLQSNGRDCMRLCIYGNGGCHHVCNRNGERTFCSCRPKYRLAEDGTTCVESEKTNSSFYRLRRRAHHTCAVDNGGCKAECEDTPIGVQCSCKAGYFLRSDRRSCQDIDECETDNGGCQYGCLNNQGSYICTCPTGHKLAPDERTCIDIDECLFNDTCWSGCVNSPGSYECTCEKGFQKFSVKRCGDINECDVNNGGCGHTCVNTAGGHYCTCDQGYKLHWNKQDCIRKSKCLSANGPQPSALLGCSGRACMIDCKTTSSFHVYNTTKPGYTYTCEEQQIGSSTNRREKRMPVTARPIWWNHNLIIDESLPDCPALTIVQQHFSFSYKVDHCHLLKMSSGPRFFSRSSRGFIDKFSISCQSVKKKKSIRTLLSVDVVFNIRIPSKKCNIKCKKGKVIRYGKRAFSLLKRSVSKQLFRLKFNSDQLLVRRKSNSRREVSPGIRSAFGCLYGEERTQEGSCSSCNEGSFYNLTSSTCVSCPSGTYQDQKGQITCKRCPTASSVENLSSTSIFQCPGLCPPGRFSRDGLLPCQPCPLGTYQPEVGRLGCFSCGNRLTTRTVGSESFSKCLLRAECNPGHFYNTHTSSCSRCPVGYYQNETGKNFCYSCPGNTTTDYDASDDVEACKDTRCGGVFGDILGVIESPNYPGNYPNNVRCTWLIKPPPNRKLLLVIPEIFLPGIDCEDSLIMKNKRGPSPGKVTYQSCQTYENPDVITALSKRLYIEFNSNDNVGKKGFQIPYATYDENYDAIIQDIIQDHRLKLPNFHQNILKDKKSRQTLLEVLAVPEMYFKISPQVTTQLLPSSFVSFLKEKVKKFLSET